MDDKIKKEISDYELEKVSIEKRMKLVRKNFIKDLQNGMGEDMKKIGSKPEKIKISFITKIKRFIAKYC